MQRKLEILKRLSIRYQTERDEIMFNINLILNQSEYSGNILDDLDSKIARLVEIEERLQMANHFIVQIQTSNLEQILKENPELDNGNLNKEGEQ
jgi:hypothetical protein